MSSTKHLFQIKDKPATSLIQGKLAHVSVNIPFSKHRRQSQAKRHFFSIPEKQYNAFKSFFRTVFLKFKRRQEMSLLI